MEEKAGASKARAAAAQASQAAESVGNLENIRTRVAKAQKKTEEIIAQVGHDVKEVYDTAKETARGAIYGSEEVREEPKVAARKKATKESKERRTATRTSLRQQNRANAVEKKRHGARN